MTIVARLGCGVLAAVVAGVVVGAVARVLMRLTTAAAGGDPGFSWSGSAGIVTLYALAMIPGACAAAATRRRIAAVLLAAGALFLCVPAVGVASEEVGDIGHLGVGPTAAVVVSGAAVFATLGVLPLVTLRLTSRFTAGWRPDRPPVARPATP